jgi:hypothetical protein
MTAQDYKDKLIELALEFIDDFEVCIGIGGCERCPMDERIGGMTYCEFMAEVSNANTYDDYSDDLTDTLPCGCFSCCGCTCDEDYYDESDEDDIDYYYYY